MTCQMPTSLFITIHLKILFHILFCLSVLLFSFVIVHCFTRADMVIHALYYSCLCFVRFLLRLCVSYVRYRFRRVFFAFIFHHLSSELICFGHNLLTLLVSFFILLTNFIHSSFQSHLLVVYCPHDCYEHVFQTFISNCFYQNSNYTI